MFGKNLRQAIEKRGISQTTAAELLQIRQPSFNYYCNLVKPPRDKTVRWLSLHLGIPCEELLDGAPPWLAKDAAGKYGGADPVWWNNLKRRWRRRENRTELELSIRVLFPDDADPIIAWLNGNNSA
jgi:transcriptional regulator with XRE-family HTH domain